MSRRRRRYRRPPPIQEFIRGIAKMPWWGGVGLAVFSFIFLHELMATPSPVATRPDQAGGVMVHAALPPMATVLQFFIPILCLIGAAASFARSRHRGRLFDSVATSQAGDSVNQLTWQDFEKLVAEAFQRDGYSVVENGGAGPDVGALTECMASSCSLKHGKGVLAWISRAPWPVLPGSLCELAARRCQSRY